MWMRAGKWLNREQLVKYNAGEPLTKTPPNAPKKTDEELEAEKLKAEQEAEEAAKTEQAEKDAKELQEKLVKAGAAPDADHHALKALAKEKGMEVTRETKKDEVIAYLTK